MNVYVASSTRGARHHRAIVAALRRAGHTVYDWTESVGRFHWSAVGVRAGKGTDAGTLRRALEHPIARRAFQSDARAVETAEVLVLVLPAGRSAHLEAGFAAGSGVPVVVYVPVDEPQEPDLMLGWASAIVGGVAAVVEEVEAQGREWTYGIGCGPALGAP